MRKDPQDLRGKWSDVFRSLLIIIVLYMGVRWALWEPFVIPSGSMESTLLVQDYVLVKKWAYGLRLPFTETWVYGPHTPVRGDIVVFKAKDESGHFLVKRVIGLPGETLTIDKQGHIHINGKSFRYKGSSSPDEDHFILTEDNGVKSYQVQFLQGVDQKAEEIYVPEGHLFMMGDNRNQSADSRYWGALPLERIVGKLDLIWMSCRESEKHSSFLCAPADFRTERLFRLVQ